MRLGPPWCPWLLCSWLEQWDGPCADPPREVPDAASTWSQGATGPSGALSYGKISINDLHITVLKADHHFQTCRKIWHDMSAKDQL